VLLLLLLVVGGCLHGLLVHPVDGIAAGNVFPHIGRLQLVLQILDGRNGVHHAPLRGHARGVLQCHGVELGRAVVGGQSAGRALAGHPHGHVEEFVLFVAVVGLLLSCFLVVHAVVVVDGVFVFRNGREDGWRGCALIFAPDAGCSCARRAALNHGVASSVVVIEDIASTLAGLGWAGLS